MDLFIKICFSSTSFENEDFGWTVSQLDVIGTTILDFICKIGRNNALPIAFLVLNHFVYDVFGLDLLVFMFGKC